jgi:hypothetical protein
MILAAISWLLSKLSPVPPSTHARMRAWLRHPAPKRKGKRGKRDRELATLERMMKR